MLPEIWTSLVQAERLNLKLIVAGISGVALHHALFKKGEWHMKAPVLLSLWAASYPVLTIEETITNPHGLFSGAINAALILAVFTFALFASIAIYRLCGHRLSSFPGPVLARVSKLWHMVQCRHGQNHLLLERLRCEYGDFVRTGPSEVTIFDPEALWKLDGPGNKTTKSVWYDFLLPDVGVTTIRQKPFHDQRRRVWTQAFSNKAFNHYETQMRQHADKLESLIFTAANNQNDVDFSALAYWFSFDVMGLFALSQSFDMLHSEKWHFAVTDLRRAMTLLGPLSPVPWLAQIGFRFLKGRWRVKDWHVMTSWCREQMERRIKINDDSLNVARYVIEDAKKRDAIDQDHNLLAGEAIVAIVAGSDTVAPTLVFLFYELARNPDQQDKLYQEVRQAKDLSAQTLQSLQHLNATIDETLRLHPAVPSGGYRDTPPEGMTIGGRWIPGNTTIVAPRYSIFRLESCFQDAESFRPERWYSEPEKVRNRRCFLPFAQGRYTCLGKDLALSELRTVTALLVSRYHIRFGRNEDGSAVEGELRDQFTAVPGSLKLQFALRDE